MKSIVLYYSLVKMFDEESDRLLEVTICDLKMEVEKKKAEAGTG